MLTITIKKDEGWGENDSFTVSPGDKSVAVTHTMRSFGQKEKSVTKKISIADYCNIEKIFEAVDFGKVFKENIGISGLDGWTLKCTLFSGSTRIEVELWSPEKDESKPETVKLLEACEMVFALL